MRRNWLVPVLLCAQCALSGCLARTAIDLATAPVRVAGKAVDLATTSQSEADEKRGRELRKREQRYGELARQYDREARRCAEGREESCRRQDEFAREMAKIAPTIPADRD